MHRYPNFFNPRGEDVIAENPAIRRSITRYVEICNYSTLMLLLRSMCLRVSDRIYAGVCQVIQDIIISLQPRNLRLSDPLGLRVYLVLMQRHRNANLLDVLLDDLNAEREILFNSIITIAHTSSSMAPSPGLRR